MKLIFILIFIAIKSYGQDSLVFKTVAFDLGVKNYVIESASDTTKTWTTIATLQPKKNKDSNIYSYPITAIYFYRVVANMQSSVYRTNSLAYHPTIKNSVTVLNTKVSNSWWTDKLTWSTTNEINVAYFLMEYSSGSSWKTLGQLVGKGGGNYSFSNSRGWFSKKPGYRITPNFQDGTLGTIVYF